MDGRNAKHPTRFILLKQKDGKARCVNKRSGRVKRVFQMLPVACQISGALDGVNIWTVVRRSQVAQTH